MKTTLRIPRPVDRDFMAGWTCGARTLGTSSDWIFWMAYEKAALRIADAGQNTANRAMKAYSEGRAAAAAAGFGR